MEQPYYATKPKVKETGVGVLNFYCKSCKFVSSVKKMPLEQFERKHMDKGHITSIWKAND